jgi:hypothetical protein
MKAYVFVAGPTDADFLRKVLPPELIGDVEFVSAGTSGSILSLARSFLVRRRKPVAVFMNSDSLNPSLIDERREGIEELIRAAAGSVPVKVIMVVPEIEVSFFAAPEAIERFLGAKVSSDLLSLGQRDPVGILRQVAKQKGRDWELSLALRVLDPHDIERMRATSPITELTAFLQHIQDSEKNGVSTA